MPDHQGSLLPRGPLGLLRATRWSLQGLRSAFATEAAFRLEVYLLVLLAPLAWLLGQDAVERVLLIAALLLVLTVELINSAIETLIERYGAEQHPLAGRAKDLGSAAVFVALTNAVLVWGGLLGPRLLSHWSAA